MLPLTILIVLLLGSGGAYKGGYIGGGLGGLYGGVRL